MTYLSTLAKVGAVSVLAFDFLWFLRLVGTRLATRFFKSRLKPLDESRVYGICTTHDLDFMGHMNNARYFRELDFGRFDYWFRTGLAKYLRAYSSAYVVQHACTIRYRRPINFLRPYVIRTRLMWWDAKSLYFEQRLQTLHDGFVRAIAISKNTVVNADVEQIMRGILAEEKVPYDKPELRRDLSMWLEFNQLNSDLLWREICSSEENPQRDGAELGGGADNLNSMRSFCVSPAEQTRIVIDAGERNRLHKDK